MTGRWTGEVRQGCLAPRARLGDLPVSTTGRLTADQYRDVLADVIPPKHVDAALTVVERALEDQWNHDRAAVDVLACGTCRRVILRAMAEDGFAPREEVAG